MIQQRIEDAPGGDNVLEAGCHEDQRDGGGDPGQSLPGSAQRPAPAGSCRQPGAHPPMKKSSPTNGSARSARPGTSGLPRMRSTRGRLAGLLFVCLGLLATPLAAPAPPAIPAASYTPSSTPFKWIRGVDASYVTRVERRGGRYYGADGSPGEFFQILRQNGINTVRLRLWRDPPEGDCSLTDVLVLAQRARQAGLALLLDLHYSDTWADPGHQAKPAAWQGLSYAELETAVYTYTRQSVSSLMQQNTPPDLIQLGNEIIGGMLWDEGRVLPAAYNTPVQWDQLAGLLQAGVRGLRDAGSTARIIIHIDRGGDNPGARWFFDRLTARGVPFDIIGLSYYSYWHGTLDQLQANLNDLAGRYGKDVMVVETAYPFTLGWNDWTDNVIGLPDQLAPGYPASQAGQQDFVLAVNTRVRAVPGGRGAGVFYWGGEWISTAITDTHGSPWENQALFGFDGRAVPALVAHGGGLTLRHYLPMVAASVP
jgi:arabinogalactan endo-1,4-beta-galactosidase